jgi:hypothetical protein
LIDFLRRDKSSVDTFGRNAKGGIEEFLESVRGWPANSSAFAYVINGRPATIGSRFAAICSASSTASGWT